MRSSSATATAPGGTVTDAGPDAEPGLTAGGLAVLLIGLALPVTDFFIVNVALPTMGRDLHASDGLLELVVSGYGVAYALLLVLGGRLGDAVGRRRLFLAGMALFTASSAACGLAPDVGALIAGRVVQGAAAALLVPQVLATIQARTEGAERGRALGRYAATAGIAMVAGQVLGGAIVALDVAGSGWRGIFLVNVPVGLFGLAAALRAVPETRAERAPTIDGGGTLLLAAALFCLLLPLSQGQSLGWPAWTWLLLALSPVAAAAFAAWERRVDRAGRTPLVPPSLVVLSSVRTGLGVALPFFLSFGGFMFVYAVATQDGLHLGALPGGLALVPYAGAFFLASLWTPRAMGRWGRRLLSAGAAGQAVGLAGLAAVVASSWPHLPVVAAEALLLVVGFGQGLVLSPLFRIILSEVPTHLAGAGSGVLVTAQQASLALGVAVLGTLYTGLGVGPGDGLRAGAVVLALQALIAVWVAAGTTRLPATVR